MVLKLFSPSENDAKKQSEVARDVARIEILREEIIKSQKELGMIKSQFDLTMAEQRKYATAEEEKHIAKIETLTKEVKALEERQKIAKFPIPASERKAYDNLERSKKTLEEAEMKSKKNDELIEILQDKIDSLSEREEDLNKRELKTKTGELNLEEQRSQMKVLSENLSKQWGDFYQKSSLKDREITEHNRLIEIHRHDLDMREDKLLEDQLILKDEQLKITSDRQTLKVAFEELNKKNGNK